MCRFLSSSGRVSSFKEFLINMKTFKIIVMPEDVLKISKIIIYRNQTFDLIASSTKEILTKLPPIM